MRFARIACFEKSATRNSSGKSLVLKTSRMSRFSDVKTVENYRMTTDFDLIIRLGNGVLLMFKPINKKTYFLLSSLACFNAQANEPIAEVIAIKGNASAGCRVLSRSSPIYKNEIVSTEQDARVKLRFTDGGIISLAEKSSFVTNNYSFNNPYKQNTFKSTLIRGGLKTITGKIGKEAIRTDDAIAAGVPKEQLTVNSNYQLLACLATIKMRGTSGTVAIKHSDDPLFRLPIFNPPLHCCDECTDPTKGPKIVDISCNEGTFEVTDIKGDVTLVGELGDTRYIEVTGEGTDYLTNNPNSALKTEPESDDDEDDDDAGPEDSDGGDDISADFDGGVRDAKN